MRRRRWRLNKLPARFAPEVLRDYWRDRALAVLLLIIVASLCWVAWEFLPRQGARPMVVIGTVRDLQRGWQAQSKYRLVRAPETTVVVALPGGGATQFFGDPQRFEHCRAGGPIRLVRRETNSGMPEWELAPDPCPPGH